MSEAKDLQTILSLTRSVEAKDVYTRGHSERVAHIAELLATDIPYINQKQVYYSGLIHDVGKLTTPDSILLKTGRLTGEEFEIIKNHTVEGAHICRSLEISDDLIKGVLYHHERWDGKGYPEGLKGEEIPLIGRILCVADSIDAMASNRAYRDALSFEYIYNEIEKGRGTQFDPEIADLCLSKFNQITYYLIEQRLKTEKNITKQII